MENNASTYLPCFATGELANPRRTSLSLSSRQARYGQTFFTSYGVSSRRLDAFTSLTASLPLTDRRSVSYASRRRDALFTQDEEPPACERVEWVGAG